MCGRLRFGKDCVEVDATSADSDRPALITASALERIADNQGSSLEIQSGRGAVPLTVVR